MDWARIEQEVQSKATSIMQSKSYRNDYSLNPNNYLPRPVEKNVTTSFRENDSTPYSRSSNFNPQNPSNLHFGNEESSIAADLSEIKNLINQQNHRISTIERTMRGFGDLIESNNSTQLNFAERLNQYELDLHSISKYSSSTNRDKSDLIVQTKTINLRLQQLEEAYKRI